MVGPGAGSPSWDPCPALTWQGPACEGPRCLCPRLLQHPASSWPGDPLGVCLFSVVALAPASGAWPWVALRNSSRMNTWPQPALPTLQPHPTIQRPCPAPGPLLWPQPWQSRLALAASPLVPYFCPWLPTAPGTKPQDLAFEASALSSLDVGPGGAEYRFGGILGAVSPPSHFL